MRTRSLGFGLDEGWVQGEQAEPGQQGRGVRAAASQALFIASDVHGNLPRTDQSFPRVPAAQRPGIVIGTERRVGARLFGRWWGLSAVPV
jgi:hypothetical protein